MSGIDNLGKGAAGQAVQNMNLMSGYPEETGLDARTSRVALNCEVRLIEVRGGLGAVPGVRLAGVHAGIKKRKTDLALIDLGGPHVCAAVITTNEIKAAPLLVKPEHIEVRRRRDPRGRRQRRLRERVHRRARHARRARDRAPSGGAAGRAPDPGRRRVDRRDRRLPADGPARSRPRTRGRGSSPHGTEARYDAAEAIMTTDHVPEARRLRASTRASTRYVVGGIAKGSGMIAPNMATMLSFIATDAPMRARTCKPRSREAVDDSFNMISVDGDMSTNDSCYAFARGPGRASTEPLGASARPCAQCAATSRSRW